MKFKHRSIGWSAAVMLLMLPVYATPLDGSVMLEKYKGKMIDPPDVNCTLITLDVPYYVKQLDALQKRVDDLEFRLQVLEEDKREQQSIHSTIQPAGWYIDADHPEKYWQKGNFTPCEYNDIKLVKP